MLAVALVTIMGAITPGADAAFTEPSAPAPVVAPIKLLPDLARPAPGLADLPISSARLGAHAMGYDLGLTPNLGVSLAAYAHASESGATFKIGDARSFLANGLQSLGVRTERPYGGAGRWYVFAALRNQALNPAPGGSGGFGWLSGIGAQAPAAVSSSGKLGLGWSKGALDTSVGYVQRQVRVLNGPMGASNGVNESVAALSFTFRPH